MNWVFRNFKWVMVVSGALTCAMVYAAIAPQAALRSTFGEALQGSVADIVVRNWATLITLVGLMLIYGAFNTAVRPLVLMVAGASKLIFIALVVSQGSRYLGHQAGIAVAVDSVWVALFAWYLLSANKTWAKEEHPIQTDS
jgi:hypothetical protein